MSREILSGILLAAVVLVACGGGPPQPGNSRTDGAMLSGEVNFAGKFGDRPIQRATVRLEQGGVTVAETATDENGRFIFEGISGSEFNLLVTKGEQYAPFDFFERNQKMLDPDLFPNGRYFLRVEMKSKSTIIRGMVLGVESQKPIERATVSTYPPTIRVTTDENGAYRLESDEFEAGINYSIQVSHPDFQNEQAMVDDLRLTQENGIATILLRSYQLEEGVKQEDLEYDEGSGKTVPGSGNN